MKTGKMILVIAAGVVVGGILSTLATIAYYKISSAVVTK